MIEARAETIGSLIRPEYLIEARQRGTEMAAAEARAVSDAIRLPCRSGPECS